MNCAQGLLLSGVPSNIKKALLRRLDPMFSLLEPPQPSERWSVSPHRKPRFGFPGPEIQALVYIFHFHVRHSRERKVYYRQDESLRCKNAYR